ncbi:MAG: Lipoprotein LpqB, beta-propeller domain-like protein [Frankiales bacterium]|nr:Lipoprotein LpqB, beta-propeller domain-like protein [Frankiales bacterium]
MSRGPATVVVLAAVLLLSGCGLPLPGTVQEPGPVTAEQQQPGDIQVLPPGPRDDTPPDQVVRDFFGAQSNPDSGHGRAREFLAPEKATVWKDGGPVSVFDGALTVTAVDGDPGSYRVGGHRVGRIGDDGSYSRDDSTVALLVRLRQAERGRWVLTDVPDGLLLSTADRDRSFRARNVYFLAPTSGEISPTTHLVPDPAFLPVTADPADALVRRLLVGPSAALNDSVGTAVPPGTSLRSPVRTDAAGVVTVDLSGQVLAAPVQQRERLSAQLVWTLRSVSGGFTKLRLLSDGRIVRVGAAGPDGLQARDDWPAYDPDGLQPPIPAFYISGRQLRSLDGGLVASEAAGDGNRQLVDVAATSPRGRTLALLTRVGRSWELSTGPVSGPFLVRERAPALASPSWGSGEQGLWFLQGSRVMLARSTGTPAVVPVDGLAQYGPISGLRVSRDGARVGLIAGSGANRRLVVGRVSTMTGRVRITGLRDVAPTVSDVHDLTWDTATSLVVLGRLSGVSAPIRVAVDGSSVALVIRIGLENSTPNTVAGAPGRQLVIGATVADGTAVLFRDNGRLYVREDGAGYAPFYPG